MHYGNWETLISRRKARVAVKRGAVNRGYTISAVLPNHLLFLTPIDQTQQPYKITLSFAELSLNQTQPPYKITLSITDLSLNQT